MGFSVYLSCGLAGKVHCDCLLGTTAQQWGEKLMVVFICFLASLGGLQEETFTVVHIQFIEQNTGQNSL